MRDELIAHLDANGSMPLPFYPDFAITDDPTSGFVLTVYSPRFSTGYFPQRNRFTVLVETHSWKPYEQRVRVTRNTLVGLGQLVSAHGREWLAQAHAADTSGISPRWDGGEYWIMRPVGANPAWPAARRTSPMRKMRG